MASSSSPRNVHGIAYVRSRFFTPGTPGKKFTTIGWNLSNSVDECWMRGGKKNVALIFNFALNSFRINLLADASSAVCHGI